MDYYGERPTVRARIRRALTVAGQPLTVADLAGQVDTTTAAARRALRELEATGEAARRVAAGGCYAWRAR